MKEQGPALRKNSNKFHKDGHVSLKNCLRGLDSYSRLEHTDILACTCNTEGNNFGTNNDAATC